MGKFTAIPKDTFDTLQLDAGIILKDFDIETQMFKDEDMICATTGGITVNATPTFSDLGEDVDNCPVNMMELKHLDSWETSIEFTSLGTSASLIALALGCATVDGNKVTPNMSLKQSDFTSVWWVGDKANGGCVAVKLFNALATSGMSLTTTKSGKGTTSVTLTGHVSISAQDVVPIEFYSIDPAAPESGSGGSETPTV